MGLVVCRVCKGQGGCFGGEGKRPRYHEKGHCTYMGELQTLIVQEGQKSMHTQLALAIFPPEQCPIHVRTNAL